MAMRVLAVVAVVVAFAACSKAGDEQASSKRSPIPPPPPDMAVPAELSIPVVVDGQPAAPVTAAQLTEVKPDFVDQDRRAWRLTNLIGAFDQAGATLEAVGREGVAVSVTRPPTPGDLQPVLFLTRRGDVVVTVVSPEQPFPEFHGQGGRLRRPGDTTPRVSPVLELRVATRPAAAGGSDAP
jgi:hypothetical protein